MPSPELSRALVGWDGSAGAAAGLRLALHLTATDGGEVTALAVVAGFTHVEDAEERAQAIEEVRAPLQIAYDATISEAGVELGQKASLKFIEAVDVAKTLDRYTSTHPIELVVVGLHGREGLLHPKMGHIASQAVRAGRCPVLVVPEPGGSTPYPFESESTGSKISEFFHPFRHHHVPSEFPGN